MFFTAKYSNLVVYYDAILGMTSSINQEKGIINQYLDKPNIKKKVLNNSKAHHLRRPKIRHEI